MATAWKEEVDTVQSIFPDELQAVEENESCLISYSVRGTNVLSLRLDDTYPTQTPEISISHHLKGLGLEEHIRSAVKDMAGTPILFDILTATKEWIDGHPFSVSPTPPSTTTASRSPPKSSAPVCRFFAKGTCRFGSKCKNYHPGCTQNTTSGHQEEGGTTEPSATSNVQSARTNQDGRSPEKRVLHDASNKNGPEKSLPVEKEAAKKNSMRTAADVIKRIRWDTDLPTEKFCVGYLDRFVGIIEKPFSAFTWEDLATLAPNVLAVPEHRIQYFKYVNEIVWDKTKQLDNVFGSRGGKLIQDVIQAHAEAHSGDGTESETTPTETANSDAAHHRNTQERPTHFICFRIRDESITAQAEKVQNHILKGIPDLSEGCVLVTALHVTVCMVQLKTPQHVDIARSVMEKTKEFLSQYVPKNTNIVINGVDNFQDRLVYAKVEPNKALDRLSYLLIERLQDAGLKTPGNYDVYTPHMTLVKMSRPLQRTIDTKVIRRELYTDFSNTYFGKQGIEGICLCSMRDPKQEDGFFLRLHDISNSVLHLSPAIPSLFSKMVAILKASSVEVSGELELEPQDVSKFDNSVKAIGQLVKENLKSDSFKNNSLNTRVVILRGLPGSGKSYLARNCSSPNGIICSSDDYFSSSKSQGYQFDRKRLPEAHAHCCKQFVQAIADGCDLVVVDNTNSMRWEYRVYTHLCQLLGLKCTILEIPHPNMNIVSSYLSRNVHGLTLTAVKDYTDRWEEDEDAIRVPPAIAYPKSSDLQSTHKISLPASITDISCTQLGKLPERIVNSTSSLELFFIGIFLTPKSQWELVSAVAPTHPVVYAEHVTLIYKPNFEALKSLKMGKRVFVTVWGVGDDGEVQAVEVDMPNGISSSNEHPHITISTIPSSAPKYSNSMLAAHPAKPLQNPLVLEGIVGVAVKESSEDVSEYFPILSKENFVKQVAPRFSNLSFKDEVSTPNVDESVSICTGTLPVTELLVFDFDGTLFDSPYPEPGKMAYKAVTGQEWPHKGWWGKVESLLPPITVGPGPTLETYRSHHSKASSATVILTARKQRTDRGVRHVLSMYDVHPDVIIFKPDDWPSDKENPEFKVLFLKKLLEDFPQVRHVRLWDDNEGNVAAFKQFAESDSRGIHFDITDASKMNSASEMLSSSTELLPFLSRCGVLATSEYYSAANIGTDFIAEQFAKLAGFTGNPAALVHVFGSYCFGRRSDVDLVVLAPPTFTPVECMEKLFDRLEACGITHLHKGYSSRCPRLKVKLTFFSHSTIEYDIIFAVLNSEEALNSCKESSTIQSLEKLLKRDDQVSKRAFFGLVFLQKVKDIIRGVVSTTNFGAVVEMVVQILKSNRLKGNCYRFIHTFHIVQLLADFTKTHKKRMTSAGELSADALFREFISHAALLQASKWEKLCGEFAAKEHIPRLIQVFQSVSKIIASQEGDSGILNYEQFLVPPSFPPEGFIPVRIICSSSNKQLQWEIENALEARLPTYIGQLLASGLQVIPEGHGISKGASFAVNKSDSSTNMVQDTFRKFWGEFSDYRKRDDVRMELKLEAVEELTLDMNDKTVKEVVEFASSQQQDCHLPASLSANERRIAHETAEKLNIGHRTEGEGKNRHIHLFKSSA